MQTLLELTLPELIKSAQGAFPDTEKRQNTTNEVVLQNVSYVPAQGALQVKCDVSNTNNSNKYSVSFLFEGVNPSDEVGRNTFEIKTMDGQSKHISRDEITNANCKVNCTCMDFKFRFALWNFNQNSLNGAKPEPYIKKTDRAPANPTQKPGLCKHQFKCVEQLQNDGFPSLF